MHEKSTAVLYLVRIPAEVMVDTCEKSYPLVRKDTNIITFFDHYARSLESQLESVKTKLAHSGLYSLAFFLAC